MTPKRCRACARLWRGGALDQGLLDRLGKADRTAMREMLAEFLPDAEAEDLLKRVDALAERRAGALGWRGTPTASVTGARCCRRRNPEAPNAVWTPTRRARGAA